MLQKDALAIGIDIGGTSIKAGLVSGAGRVVERTGIPTEESKGGEQLLDKIVEVSADLASRSAGGAVVGVGIGSPGLIDPELGVVSDCPGMIPGWTGTPVTAKVAGATGLEAFVENDVKVIALGEGWVGAARGAFDYVSLTLGTGVGGGIVQGGELLQGPAGAAALLGHITVDPDGPRCICGSAGCLEGYVSTRSIGACATDYVMRGVETSIPDHAGEGRIDARAVFEAAREGDAVALEIVHRTAKYLAAGLVTIVHVLDPEVVVIGGGVTKAGDLLMGPVRDLACRRFWRPPGAPPVRIALSELGDDAGIFGGAALAFRKTSHT